jgi:hypothetical protein
MTAEIAVRRFAAAVGGRSATYGGRTTIESVFSDVIPRRQRS